MVAVIRVVKVREGSGRIQRGHADRHSHGERVVRRAGPEEVAVRRVERRRDACQPHGVGRRARVMYQIIISIRSFCL